MDTQQSPEEVRSAGRWSREEHQRFMYAIMQYGKDWKKVEQYVRTRTGSQVRSHAQKFFNKLQKSSVVQPSGEGHQRRQEHSETEMDFERQANSEVTPSTPLELVSLIKRQEKEEGGKINLFQLRKTLDEQGSVKPMEKPAEKQDILPQSSSFKSMSNILSAYEEVSNGKELSQQQDESFFISITKKYKRLFRQVEDFDRLIDLHAANEHPKGEFSQHRKRSFTLPQGSDVGEEQIDEKIQEIKKRINVENHEGKGKAKGRVKQKQEKRERKDSESSIQYMPPPLGRLTTIQEHPHEEQQISFRAINQDRTEEKEKPEQNNGQPQQ